MEIRQYGGWKARLRGRREMIQEAKTIFNRLEELGVTFSLGIDGRRESDGNWKVRLFVSILLLFLEQMRVLVLRTYET
jgi:hypothetical protein